MPADTLELLLQVLPLVVALSLLLMLVRPREARISATQPSVLLRRGEPAQRPRQTGRAGDEQDANLFHQRQRPSENNYTHRRPRLARYRRRAQPLRAERVEVVSHSVQTNRER